MCAKKYGKWHSVCGHFFPLVHIWPKFILWFLGNHDDDLFILCRLSGNASANVTWLDLQNVSSIYGLKMQCLSNTPTGSKYSSLTLTFSHPNKTVKQWLTELWFALEFSLTITFWNKKHKKEHCIHIYVYLFFSVSSPSISQFFW